MNRLSFNRRAGLVAALILLSGCGSRSAGSVPQSASGAQVKHAKSWMLPEAKGEDLVYVSGYDTVNVYTYRTNHLVGPSNFEQAGYECTDQQGDVFIPALNGPQGAGVYKFAHGATEPTSILSVPGARACAVDQGNGNVAAINSGPTVYIFPNGSGTPETFTDSDLYLPADLAYDNSGNLFIDGSYARNIFRAR